MTVHPIDGNIQEPNGHINQELMEDSGSNPDTPGAVIPGTVISGEEISGEEIPGAEVLSPDTGSELEKPGSDMVVAAEAPKPEPEKKEMADVEALFWKYKDSRDPSIREQLILMHDKLVRFLARKFADRGEPLNDLVQVGYIGLINAVDRFDPERGTKFSTYATPTIVGEIRRHFRDTRWSLKVPRRLQELNLAVRKLTDQMSHQLGHSPTVEEMAKKLQVTEEDVLEAMELGFVAYETVSLDATVEIEGDMAGTTLSDFVGSTDQTLDSFDMNYRLKEAIEELDGRERLVITLKFFDSLSQTDIAKRLNCSQMQVSRIQRRALAKLKEAMRD